MEINDIISYHAVVTAEKAALQKGINFGVGKKYSVFLMSLRENALYADTLDPITVCSRMWVTTNRRDRAARTRKKSISL